MMNIFSFKKKGIIVFVKNKLISLDSIIPILLELKEGSNLSTTFVVFDKLAHDSIKANIVLNDLVNYLGVEIYVNKGIENKIIRKPVILLSLIEVFFKFTLGYKIIHFGALNSSPLKYLFSFKKTNIFLSQQDSFRHTWSKYNHLIGHRDNSDSSQIMSKNIIVFNDMMNNLNKYSLDKNIFFFGETRTRKVWIDYCTKKSNYYFKKYHKDLDFSQGFIVYILTTFEGLDGRYINDKTGISNLFNETIEILASFNLPVLLKPHVHTDLAIVNKVINNKKNMHITYIHPTILALESKCFIANLYSTTFADAYSLGVPTIEYTDYPIKILEVFNNKSMGYEYVDYFVNNNPVLLKKSLQKALLRKKTYRLSATSNDDSGLLKKLSE
jgi:hypothetical protein